MNIAALYVETGGAYFGLPGVDPWDEARDARRYAGPLPVVAHPPCQRYGYEKARRIGVVAMVGGKHKTRIRNATPPEFRDLLLSIARTASRAEAVAA